MFYAIDLNYSNNLIFIDEEKVKKNRFLLVRSDFIGVLPSL